MHRFPLAAGVLLAAVAPVLAQTVVYSTGFETPSFSPGAIAGQSGWTLEASAATLNAQVQSATVNTGAQALKITSNSSGPAGGWVYYDPIQLTPIASNTPLVTAEFSMYLSSAGSLSGGWGMDVFSSDVNFMSSWQVNSANKVFAQDGLNGFVSSTASVTRDAWNTYKVVMDFANLKYDIFVNNLLFHDNLNLQGANGIIGDFDFRQNQQTPATDFALFDDFSVTVASPAPAPIEWGNVAGGSWTTPTDWIGGIVPNSTTAIAKLGTVISTPRTISMTGGLVTVDQLQITSPVAYTLSGIVSTNPWTLRFAGTGATALDVTAGSHEFNTNVLLDKSAAFNIATGARVRFRQQFLTAGQTLSKTGGGALLVRELRGSALNIAGGTVQLTAGGTFVGTSVLTGLTVSGGTLDLGSNVTGASSKLLVDYTGASPIQTLRDYLLNGKIIDSLNFDPDKAIGYAEASAIGLTQLDGSTSNPTTVDSTAILLRVVVRGDANLSGTVNLDDFTALAGGFGSGNVWTQGDFNYSSTVDLDDFTILAANFGVSGAEPARSAVPEPTGLALSGAAILATCIRRSRS